MSLCLTEHGVNALEIFACLGASVPFSTDAGQIARLRAAVANLTLPYAKGGPDYYSNLINLRIQVPWDENFSDDELILVPFLSLLLAEHLNPGKTPALDMNKIRDSLYHVWQLVSPSRSSLWSAIALFGDQNQPAPRMSSADQKKATDDMLWNLRTWPLDQVGRSAITITITISLSLSLSLSHPSIHPFVHFSFLETEARDG